MDTADAKPAAGGDEESGKEKEGEVLVENSGAKVNSNQKAEENSTDGAGEEESKADEGKAADPANTPQ